MEPPAMKWDAYKNCRSKDSSTKKKEIWRNLSRNHLHTGEEIQKPYEYGVSSPIRLLYCFHIAPLFIGFIGINRSTNIINSTSTSQSEKANWIPHHMSTREKDILFPFHVQRSDEEILFASYSTTMFRFGLVQWTLFVNITIEGSENILTPIKVRRVDQSWDRRQENRKVISCTEKTVSVFHLL